jgi:hypothetical protein
MMSETQPTPNEVQQYRPVFLRDQYDPHQLRQVLVERMNAQLPEGVNPPRQCKQYVLSSLYAGYERHRTVKTWGTPEVSRPFFQTAWESPHGLGLKDALVYALRRTSQDVGDPHHNPWLKVAAMLIGSVLLLTGIEDMATSEDADTQPVLMKLVRAGGQVVLNATYGLLFFAQGESGPAGSYSDETEESIEYRPLGRSSGDGYEEGGDQGDLDLYETDWDRS